MSKKLEEWEEEVQEENKVFADKKIQEVYALILNHNPIRRTAINNRLYTCNNTRLMERLTYLLKNGYITTTAEKTTNFNGIIDFDRTENKFKTKKIIASTNFYIPNKKPAEIYIENFLDKPITEDRIEPIRQICEDKEQFEYAYNYFTLDTGGVDVLKFYSFYTGKHFNSKENLKEWLFGKNGIIIEYIRTKNSLLKKLINKIAESEPQHELKEVDYLNLFQNTIFKVYFDKINASLNKTKYDEFTNDELFVLMFNALEDYDVWDKRPDTSKKELETKGYYDTELHKCLYNLLLNETKNNKEDKQKMRDIILLLFFMDEYFEFEDFAEFKFFARPPTDLIASLVYDGELIGKEVKLENFAIGQEAINKLIAKTFPAGKKKKAVKRFA